MVGKKFGKLTVLERYGSKNNKATWLCVCECGNYTVVTGTHLRAGDIVSCGCYRSSEAAKRAESRIKHGDTTDHKNTRLYNIWHGMKRRCFDSKDKAFAHYGGRGISICDEWMIYKNFKEWSMDNGYSKSMTIDRIDVNKGYSPDNCRWATYKQQANNKRNNIYILYDGQKHTISEWADIFGIDYSIMKNKIRAKQSINQIAEQFGYRQNINA